MSHYTRVYVWGIKDSVYHIIGENSTVGHYSHSHGPFIAPWPWSQWFNIFECFWSPLCL